MLGDLEAGEIRPSPPATAETCVPHDYSEKTNKNESDLIEATDPSPTARDPSIVSTLQGETAVVVVDGKQEVCFVNL